MKHLLARQERKPVYMKLLISILVLLASQASSANEQLLENVRNNADVQFLINNFRTDRDGNSIRGQVVSDDLVKVSYSTYLYFITLKTGTTEHCYMTYVGAYELSPRLDFTRCQEVVVLMKLNSAKD